MLRKLIREPIVHFIALGAVLFFLAGRTPRVGAPESDQIIVTSGQIDSLTVGFTRTWMRPPSTH